MKSNEETEYQGWTIDGRFAGELDDALWVERSKTSAEDWIVRVFIARPEISDSSELTSGFERAFTEYGGDLQKHRNMWSGATTDRYSLRLGNGTVPAWLIEFSVEAGAGQREIFDFNVKLLKVARVDMKSCGQLSYTDCDAILERRRARPSGAATKYFGEFWIDREQLREQLLFLRSLARQLAVSRNLFGSGAAPAAGDWELTEDGVWRELAEEERGAGYLIVREMMILANRMVSEWCSQRNIKFLYRSQKAVETRAARQSVPHRENAPAENGDGSDFIAGNHRAGDAVPERAVYSDRNDGHFALGFTIYGHFSSPLRRFADYLNWAGVAGYLDDRAAAGSGLQSIKTAVMDILQANKKAVIDSSGTGKTKTRSDLMDAYDRFFWRESGLHLSAREQTIKENAALRREDDRVSEVGEWISYFSRDRMTAGRAAFIKRRFDQASEPNREKLWKQILDRQRVASDNDKDYSPSIKTGIISSPVSFPSAAKTSRRAQDSFAAQPDKIAAIDDHPTPNPIRKIRWSRITHQDTADGIASDATHKSMGANRKGKTRHENGNSNGNSSGQVGARLSIAEALDELITKREFGIREAFQWIFRPFRHQLIDGSVQLMPDETICIEKTSNEEEKERDRLRCGLILDWITAEWGRSRAILEYGRQQKWLYVEVEDVESRSAGAVGGDVENNGATKNFQAAKPAYCIRINALIKIPRNGNSTAAKDPFVVCGEGKGRTKAAAREAAARNVLMQVAGLNPVTGVLENLREAADAELMPADSNTIIMNETKAEKARREIEAARDNHLARSGNFVGWLNETGQRLKLETPLWSYTEKKNGAGKTFFEARLAGEFIEQLMQIRRTAHEEAADFSNGISRTGQEPFHPAEGNGATKAEAKQMAVRCIWEKFTVGGETIKTAMLSDREAEDTRQVVVIPKVEHDNYIAAILEWLQMFAPGETLEFKVSQKSKRELSDGSAAESPVWFKELPGDGEELLWLAELTDIPPIEGTVFRAAHKQVKRAKQLVAAEVYETLQMCAAPKG